MKCNKNALKDANKHEICKIYRKAEIYLTDFTEEDEEIERDNEPTDNRIVDR